MLWVPRDVLHNLALVRSRSGLRPCALPFVLSAPGPKPKHLFEMQSVILSWCVKFSRKWANRPLHLTAFRSADRRKVIDTFRRFVVPSKAKPLSDVHLRATSRIVISQPIYWSQCGK